MKPKRDSLRNKKRVGKGLRTGTGGCSYANTKHLMRILIYLELRKTDCMTGISRNIGTNAYYIKDGLLFLCKIGMIQKVVDRKVSSSVYYKLKRNKKRGYKLK